MSGSKVCRIARLVAMLGVTWIELSRLLKLLGLGVFVCIRLRSGRLPPLVVFAPPSIYMSESMKTADGFLIRGREWASLDPKLRLVG